MPGLWKLTSGVLKPVLDTWTLLISGGITFGGNCQIGDNAADSHTLYGDLSGSNAAGPEVRGGTAASATVPTLVPNKADDDTGVGWTTDELDLIVNGTKRLAVTTAGAAVTGTLSSTGTVQATTITATNTVVLGDEAKADGAAPTAGKGFTRMSTTVGVGEISFTLPNGSLSGQVKVLTVTALAGGTTIALLPTAGNILGVTTKIAFDTVGEAVMLAWSGSAWAIISNNGGVIS